MGEVGIGWPAATALAASVVAIVIGAVKLLLSGRSKVSIDTVYAEQRAMSKRVQELELDVARLNTSMEAMTTQLANAREDMAKVSDRLDVIIEKGYAR